MMECIYRNDTDRMVIVKCIGTDHFYIEKVVMPTEMFWFEAPRTPDWKSGKCRSAARCCMYEPTSATMPKKTNQ